MCEEKMQGQDQGICAEKETVGSASLKLAETQDSFAAQEIQEAVHAGSNSELSYEDSVREAVKRGLEDEAIYGDFYVVVLFKKERLLHNVVRQMFFYRQSCPTPQYDQTVYKYLRREEELEYLWTVPDVAACLNLPIEAESLPTEQGSLISMIKDFRSGKLDRRAAELNKELDLSSATL